MNIAINSKITWVSAAGRLTGTVTNITLSPSASGAITPWIDISYGKKRSVRLCGLDSALKMMKVEIDAVPEPEDMVERVNLMSGKTYMEPRDTPMCCSPSSETFWSM